jgi:hypothetical protein
LCGRSTVAIIGAIPEVPMRVERLDTRTARALPRRRLLRRAWDWWWWSVRTYMADRHFLQRPPPPGSDPECGPPVI